MFIKVLHEIKRYLEYLFVIIFFFLSRLIGINLSSLLGGTVFSLYGLFSKRNSIALSNLEKVFPNKKLKEKKKIIRNMWFHFGRIIGEYPHLKSINIFENPNIKIKNIQNLLGPLKKEKKCIFFSAHIGNWELTSHPLTQNGYKIYFIYRAPNNRLVDNLLRRIRQDYGVNLIKKGPQGAKDCIKVLKENGNIGMLIDQKMNDGVPSLFFGRKAMTAPAIVKLSMKFKCPIVPAVCIREKGIKYSIEYFKPIRQSKLKKFKNEYEILNYLNTYIESWIKNNPSQWMWIHNRW